MNVTESTRSVRVALFGAEANYTDGSYTSDESAHATGEWTCDLDAELEDMQALPISLGMSHHESEIARSSIVFSLDGSAQTAGMHTVATASVHQEHQVRFTLASPARFEIRAHVGVTPGLNRSEIRLADSNDNDIFALHAALNGDASEISEGILPAGEYMLDAHLDLAAIGSIGFRQFSTGNTECEFVLLPIGSPGVKTAEASEEAKQEPRDATLKEKSPVATGA